MIDMRPRLLAVSISAIFRRILNFWVALKRAVFSSVMISIAGAAVVIIAVVRVAVVGPITVAVGVADLGITVLVCTLVAVVVVWAATVFLFLVAVFSSAIVASRLIITAIVALVSAAIVAVGVVAVSVSTIFREILNFWVALKRAVFSSVVIDAAMWAVSTRTMSTEGVVVVAVFALVVIATLWVARSVLVALKRAVFE